MNDLIYICVRGEPFRHMANMLCMTLRTRGNYRGDIMIFTPDICPVIASAVQEWDAIPRIIDWPYPQMLDRVHALRHIESAVYSTVTCLDADCLAFNDINPMLRDMDHVRLNQENWQSYSTQPAGMYVDFMNDDERIRWADLHPVNVGCITFPSTLHGALAKEWIRLVETKDWRLGLAWGTDQSSFNYLMRCGLFPTKPYDHGDVANATKVPEADWHRWRIVHWAGYGQKLASMRKHAANETPPACAEGAS